jgi:WD40 repeat protein
MNIRLILIGFLSLPLIVMSQIDNTCLSQVTCIKPIQNLIAGYVGTQFFVTTYFNGAHENLIEKLSFFENGKYVVSNAKNEIKFWDSKTYKFIRTYTSDYNEVMNLARRKLSTEEAKHSLENDEVENAKNFDELDECAYKYMWGNLIRENRDYNRINAITKSPLFSVSSDKLYIAISDYPKQSPGFFNKKQEQKLSAVSILNFRTESTKPLQTIILDNSPLSALAYSPDSRYLACGFENGFIHIIETNHYKRVKSIKANHISKLIYSPDGRFLVIIDQQDDKQTNAVVMIILNTNNYQIFQILNTRYLHSINDFCFSPDGQYFAYASNQEITIGEVPTNLIMKKQ